ncbi:MAG: DUF839 domain-containing protein [Burkholderiales bacterium]|nr:DUF839 domain-containing protein [Phycisphaerae bacterium]
MRLNSKLNVSTNFAVYFAIAMAVIPVVSVSAQVIGPSTTQSPYVIPSVPGVQTVSIASNGPSTPIGSVGNETYFNLNTGVQDYRFVGIPDGLGARSVAFSSLPSAAQNRINSNPGQFGSQFMEVYVNHELGAGAGIARAHGRAGAFVSKWVIDNNWNVVGAADVITQAKLWNTGTSSYDSFDNDAGTPAIPALPSDFGRFCSADLPAPTAFFNSGSGLGTQERIFMKGEEVGNEGRAFGTVVTGANAGTTWELPRLGKFSWENSVAHPNAGNSTLVLGTDDSTPGETYLYVGTKTSTGSEVERAGLTNGSLYGIRVTDLAGINSTETRGTGLGTGPGLDTTSRFDLFNHGNVENMTGTALDASDELNGVTDFLRPEDSVWDPNSPNDLYFVTTDTVTASGGRSRLYRLRFDDIANPTAGGAIEMLLEGTEGGEMFDNMTLSTEGGTTVVLLQEDVGNNVRLGKTWKYNISTDAMLELAAFDPKFFSAAGANYLGTLDEEASGIIPLPAGFAGPNWYLADVQAHYNISGELVQGGQLFAMQIPEPTSIAVLGLAGLIGLRRRR